MAKRPASHVGALEEAGEIGAGGGLDGAPFLLARTGLERTEKSGLPRSSTPPFSLQRSTSEGRVCSVLEFVYARSDVCADVLVASSPLAGSGLEGTDDSGEGLQESQASLRDNTDASDDLDVTSASRPRAKGDREGEVKPNTGCSDTGDLP